MKNSFRFALLVTATLMLAACGRTNVANNSTAPSPAASAPAESPTSGASPSAPVPLPDDEAASTPSPQASAPANAGNGQTYRQPQGLFEISFPAGYTYRETDSTLTFSSSDGGFGGVVEYGSAEGKRLSTQQLEDALKQGYEDRLEQVSWQDTQLQPDGSVRVDWIGRDKEGRDLDAISFIEQRGDTIFILNLFAVDKPYNDYNDDAEAIVGTYRVKQQ
ncbi:hypothetical protein H6F67_08260 [Microcoleus sp. FACHB-1515]|uniref:LptM family lipoprotein n=1 Tax=Cyanophyceae TaxID=3028117 RepID=UPI00168555CC|nr:hypothetical protein [Microcoleus sp. FACHB-1515]MBD2089845.1 hypothetical protein [Microcoleus sp. FACHB-1515]